MAGGAGVGPPATAVVIGNGAIGLASAIALQRAGVAVTLVAPEGAWRGASWGNAGHIAVEQVAPLACPATIRTVPQRLFSRGGAVSLPPREIAAWAPFAMRLLRASTPARFAAGKAALSAALATAIPAWRRLLAAAGVPHLLREQGHVILWETPATASAGRAHWLGADTGTATVHDLDAADMARLRTLARVPVAGAVRVDGSAQIADPTRLGVALGQHVLAAGARIVTERASGVAPREGRARVFLADGVVLDADVALVAAGAASAPLLKGTGLRAPLIAERGYHLEAAAPGWPADLPPVVFEDRAMIVTRFADTLRAAGFVEFARADAPPDFRKWRRLDGHARAVGLPFAEPVRAWIGARPTLPDYLPAIGRSRTAPAIAYAFGHQHLGLTLAATTGEAVVAMLRGGPMPFALDPFDLARF